MAESASFDDLKKRLAAGDQSAAEEILSRFARRLIALAKTRLSPTLRRKIDPEDVLQSVWKSFFRRQSKDELELHGWDSLWGLLAIITIRKCGRAAAYFGAAQRDSHRETWRAPKPDESIRLCEPMANDPTPAEAAALNELLEETMRPLRPRDRVILSLRLQGYEIEEISAEVGCTERTVYRMLAEIKKRLRRLI